MSARSDRLSDALAGFRHAPTDADAWSLRLIERISLVLEVRQGIVLPPRVGQGAGALISVQSGGGSAWDATANLTAAGLRDAACRALKRARAMAGISLVAGAQPVAGEIGTWGRKTVHPLDEDGADLPISRLQRAAKRLHGHPAIVDWSASVRFETRWMRLATSRGGDVEQEFHYVIPGLRAVANRGLDTQSRSWGFDRGRLSDERRIDEQVLLTEAERLADEVMRLVEAPDCPAGRQSLLLLPGQMALQIHESVGHPLELDRILGDERNYAGTSFVTTDMLGHFRYGSDALNVTFDPALEGELAGYGFDDTGHRATREYLIRQGILLRPLGGSTSQWRAGVSGVACERVCDWNRPAIDRMANLNLEPGGHSLVDLVAGVERGVMMDTNRSWSIDDSRNKFQFGCEVGREIRDGELRGWVKNPGYRGITTDFWRNLTGVGDGTTFAVMGVNNCGKGEPNQTVRVGHAAPACLFRDVEVFGAA